MQINLVPKTREKEQKKAQLSYILSLIGIAVIVVTVIACLVIFGMNVAKKSKVKSLEKNIGEARDKISDYSEIEENVSYLVAATAEAKAILESRKEWNKILDELQSLMPREAFLTEVSIEGNKMVFKTKTTSSGKVAEFINSLMSYEFERIIEEERENSENGEEDNNTEEQKEKIKLFENVTVSNYSKQLERERMYYFFDVEATFTEEIWKK